MTRDSRTRRSVRDPRLREAVAVVLARQERWEHPQGTWQDGLWWPDAEERRPCCEPIRPTLANKQALESHCRSQVHVAQLFGVSRADLRSATLEVRRERLGDSRPALAPSELPLGAGLDAVLASTQAVLGRAQAELRRELDQISPWLDRELAGEAEELTDLLAMTESLGKRVELFRRLVELFREAEGAEQVYRQLQRPA